MPKAGDRFVNKDYAETLRMLAKEGGESFYRGSIARRIADDMAANGGVIAFEDLAQYRAMERKPLVGRYHGHLVYSVPAPAPTGLQIVETLQILDQLRAESRRDLRDRRRLLCTMRSKPGACATVGARIADPERWPVDLGNHLEPGHALERFKLIDPKKVYSAAGGRGGGLGAQDSEASQGREDASADRRVQTGTTSFVVADGEGNMIAFTQTLSTWGGNYYVSKGLGFLYNDHFRGGGGRGGGFGSTLPLMRSASTSVPTLVFAPSSDATGAYGVAGYSSAHRRRRRRQCVDSRVGLQHHPERRRWRPDGATGDRGAASADWRRRRRPIERADRRSHRADDPRRTSRRGAHAFTKVGRKGEVKYGYAAVAVVDAAKRTVEGGAEPRRSHATAAPGR